MGGKNVARGDAEHLLLTTPRLCLLPAPVDFLEALLDGRLEDAERLLRVRLPPGWPTDAAARAGLPIHLKRLREDAAQWPWRVRLVLRGPERLVVGAINLKGRPDAEGRVDMSWGVEPAYRGQGLATEAAAAVVAWALAQPGVQRVTATISPDNLPSLAVARRLGMRHAGVREGPSPALVFAAERPSRFT